MFEGESVIARLKYVSWFAQEMSQTAQHQVLISNSAFKLTKLWLCSFTTSVLNTPLNWKHAVTQNFVAMMAICGRLSKSTPNLNNDICQVLAFQIITIKWDVTAGGSKGWWELIREASHLLQSTQRQSALPQVLLPTPWDADCGVLLINSMKMRFLPQLS